MDADALYAQGQKNYQEGHIGDAMTCFEQAHAAFLAQPNEKQAATVANDLGVVYYFTGRRDQAKQIFQDALATFEKCGDVPGQAKTLGNLARILDRSGDKNGAERNYQRAAELLHQVGEKQLEHDTYRALSQMELRRGRWLQALAAYDRALAASGSSGLLRWFFQIPLKLVGLR